MSVERNDWISGFTQSDFQDRFSYVAPCKIVSKTSCCGTILIWYPKTNGLKNTLDEDPLCKITFQAGNCELFKLFQRNVACWRHFVHLKTAIVWFAFELTESFSTRSRKEHNSDKVSVAIECQRKVAMASFPPKPSQHEDRTRSLSCTIQIALWIFYFWRPFWNCI